MNKKQESLVVWLSLPVIAGVIFGLMILMNLVPNIPSPLFNSSSDDSSEVATVEQFTLTDFENEDAVRKELEGRKCEDTFFGFVNSESLNSHIGTYYGLIEARKFILKTVFTYDNIEVYGKMCYNVRLDCDDDYVLLKTCKYELGEAYFHSGVSYGRDIRLIDCGSEGCRNITSSKNGDVWMNTSDEVTGKKGELFGVFDAGLFNDNEDKCYPQFLIGNSK